MRARALTLRPRRAILSATDKSAHPEPVEGRAANRSPEVFRVARLDVCALDDLPPAPSPSPHSPTAPASASPTSTASCSPSRTAAPHLLAPLSAGDLNGAHIVCPWHNSEFDMRTGRTKKWLPTGLWNRLDSLLPPPPPFLAKFLKPTQIRTFPVTVENGRILLSDDQ